jgi:glycosyltransferase involved in cell wall biosynthesis
MRVAFCMLRSAIDRRDGGAESIRNLTEGLWAIGGMEINVISSSGSYPGHQSYAPYPWKDSKAIPLIGHFYRTVRSAAVDHDLLVLVLPNPAFGYLGDVIKRRVKKPVLVNYESRWHTPATYSFLGDNLAWKNLGRMIAFNKITSSLSRRSCDRYIVSTQFQKNELIDVGYDPDQLSVISNCTNISKYRFKGKAYREKISPNTIMYLGHFNHSKGIDLLIEAMPGILSSLPETNLFLIWNNRGGEYARIMRLIELHGLINHIHFINKIVDVSETLSQADALALPYRSLSKTRIIPSVLLEAFSIGIPLVVSNCEPIKDIVHDRKTGIIVPVNDSKAIEKGIIELLENKALREQMIQSQRQTAENSFSHTVIARKYKNIFMEILNG